MILANLSFLDAKHPKYTHSQSNSNWQGTPFFLIGCPRSGTTLLQTILNRHSGFILPPELKLFHRYHRASLGVRRQTIRRINHDLNIELTDDLANRSVDTDRVYNVLFEKYSHICGKPCAVHLGDKTPEHTFRLPWVFEVYPKAKAIALVRDPRDVALSLTRVPWIKCGILSGASLWLEAMNSIEAARSRFPNQIHLVRYEDLLEDPVGQLVGILRFLGVSLDDALVENMLEPHPNDQFVVPHRELEWKWRSSKQLDRSRVGQWEGLEATSLARVESICQKEMELFGYERVGSAQRFWPYYPALATQQLRMLASVPMNYFCEEFSYQIDSRLRGWRA